MIRSSLLYGVIVILIVALAIQFTRWRHAAATEQELTGAETAKIRAAHAKWLKQVSDAEAEQCQLEARLLWLNPEGLLPALGIVSDKLSISLVGVEELRAWNRSGYGAQPLELAFTGNYSGFTTFLSVIERLVPAVRIESMRLYRRKQAKETLQLNLTLAPMISRVDSSGLDRTRASIKTPSIDWIDVKCNPFALDLPAPESAAAPQRADARALPELTGILWHAVKPMAILNGECGGVGEVIAGAAILSIDRNQVVVKHNGENHVLGLWRMNEH